MAQEKKYGGFALLVVIIGTPQSKFVLQDTVAQYVLERGETMERYSYENAVYQANQHPLVHQYTTFEALNKIINKKLYG